MLYINAIVEGLVFSVLMFIYVSLILKFNARLEMKSYPKEILDTVEPQTKKEKTKLLLVGLPALILFMAYLIFQVKMDYSVKDVSFWILYAHYLIIFMIWNVFDLLIFDWLIFCTITPKFIILPGTEGNPGYKNYKYHLVGFGKGCIIQLFTSAILAAIVYFV